MATIEEQAPKARPARDMNRFRRAADRVRDMTPDERIQLLVKAGLMSQEDADAAKQRRGKS